MNSLVLRWEYVFNWVWNGNTGEQKHKPSLAKSNTQSRLIIGGFPPLSQSAGSRHICLGSAHIQMSLTCLSPNVCVQHQVLGSSWSVSVLACLATAS